MLDHCISLVLHTEGSSQSSAFLYVLTLAPYHCTLHAACAGSGDEL